MREVGDQVFSSTCIQADAGFRYGETMPTAEQQPTWRIRPHDPKSPGPFVTFTFRYRTKGQGSCGRILLCFNAHDPLDWLVEQGIISPDDEVFGKPPTPLPLEAPLPAPAADRPVHEDHEHEVDDPELDDLESAPVSPRSPQDSLGLLGMRPAGSRVSD